MNLRTKLTDLGASVLIALLLSLSLTQTVLNSFSASVSPLTTAALCLVFALFCALLLINRLTMLISLAGAALLAVYLALTKSPINALTSLAQSLSAVLQEKTALPAGDALTLCVLMSLLFALISFFLVRMSGGVYPALLLFVFMLLGHWILNAELSAVMLVPGLIALSVLYARAYRESGALWRALPISLIAALLTVALLPAPGTTLAPLQDSADKVRELFNDYFRFSDPRTVYSIAEDGYQPNSEYLGGQAEPRQTPIMTVETSDSVLLRGAISRTYTGHNWVDEAVNSRYLLIDPTRRKKFDAAFNGDLNEALQSCLKPISARVTFRHEGTSTLFVPARLDRVDIDLDLVSYYNETGEIFLTRGVESGDSYALEGWIIDAPRDELIATVNAAAAIDDSHWLDVCNEYITLPAGIESDLYWLTMDIVEGCETPIEKAYALADYLRSNGFVYTLNGAYPPEGRDFVSWFVLDEKQGYCTYYASAMAVMARLCDIPSRYAEGYCVVSDDTGSIDVTAEDAHAWAELYFNGIGWIEFDVTPGSTYSSQHIVPPDESAPSASLPPATPTPTPEPTPSPEPTAVPANEPTPTASDEPTPSSVPDFEATNTPEPDEEPTPSPQPDEPPKPPARRHTALWIVLALVLLLLAGAFYLARRLRQNTPPYRAEQQSDPREKTLIWYRALLTLLARRGLTPEGGESPAAFAARAADQGDVPRDFVLFARVIEAMQYANRTPDETGIRLGEALYNALIDKMDRRERLKWSWDCLRHGSGDTRQIP